MKRLIRSLFGSMGLEIRRKGNNKGQLKRNDMTSGFRRFGALNLPINSIIDVGAASGTWSVNALRTWPNASYLLFEPLVERKQVLEELSKRHANFKFMPFAAGNENSTLNFAITDDLDGSGVASHKTNPSAVRSVLVVRLDDAVKETGLTGPFIVKLDCHGYEVPILEGCRRILDNVSLFIIECYGFQIADNSLLFWEMCQYMDSLGFRLFDVVDVMHRPKDGAFWQCDAFFIRKSNSLFSHNSFK